MQSTSTLTRVASRTKRKRCSISTLNFSPRQEDNDTDTHDDMSTFHVFRFPLFTNLPGIVGIALTRFLPYTHLPLSKVGVTYSGRTFQAEFNELLC
jgi:hypothetical protein